MKTIKNSSALFVAVVLFSLALSPAARANILAMPEEFQQYNRWCWAAVSQAVLEYYGYNHQQCELAEYTRTVTYWHDFGEVDCCESSDTPGWRCNWGNYSTAMGGSVQDILRHFGGFTINKIVFPESNPYTMDTIETELAAHRPFLITWSYPMGGRHLLVGYGLIRGTDGSDSYLYYMDPWFGEGYTVSTYDWVLSGSDHEWIGVSEISVSPTCVCGTVDGCCDGCRPQADGTPCDDNDPTTAAEVCEAAVCVGTVCDDDDGDDVCNEDDLCWGDDAQGDADNDGVCNDLDICEGDDATGDWNGDGTCDDLDPPAALIFTSPECGSTIHVEPGETVEFTVTAEDAPARSVTLDASGLPPDAIMDPALPITGNPVSSLLTWTTDYSHNNTGHIVEFTATNEFGSYARCRVGIEVGDYTLVTLVSFTAIPGDGQVTLHWTTASEIDNAGFYLLRSTEAARGTVRLHKGLIPAMGDVFMGAEYEYVDYTVTNGVEYEYVLVDVDLYGTETSHPAVRATPNPTDPASKRRDPGARRPTGTRSSHRR